MRRVSIIRLSAIALVACALLPNEAIGQQRSLKEQDNVHKKEIAENHEQLRLRISELEAMRRERGPSA